MERTPLYWTVFGITCIWYLGIPVGIILVIIDALGLVDLFG
jgi:hypothetical protein